MNVSWNICYIYDTNFVTRFFLHRTWMIYSHRARRLPHPQWKIPWPRLASGAGQHETHWYKYHLWQLPAQSRWCHTCVLFQRSRVQISAWWPPIASSGFAWLSSVLCKIFQEVKIRLISPPSRALSINYCLTVPLFQVTASSEIKIQSATYKLN